jgi:hypothetical protein
VVLQAKRNARSTYDSEREQADCQNAEDLKAIRKHTDKVLEEARTKSEIEIAAFKADLKAQCSQRKADLEQDAILTRCTPKKPRPGPIDTLRSRRSKSHSSSCCPSPSGSIAMQMETDADNPHAPQIKNSPTPTNETAVQIPAPRPLEPPSKSSKLDDLLNMMATGFKNMGDLIDFKLEKALAPINSRLRHLKNKDVCQPDDIHPTYGISDVDIDSGAVSYMTPKQLKLLRDQAAMKEYDDLYVDNEREFEERVNEEERLRKKWVEGDETVQRKMIASRGR